MTENVHKNKAWPIRAQMSDDLEKRGSHDKGQTYALAFNLYESMCKVLSHASQNEYNQLIEEVSVEC